MIRCFGHNVKIEVRPEKKGAVPDKIGGYLRQNEPGESVIDKKISLQNFI
jgi:hypothetical protein